MATAASLTDSGQADELREAMAGKLVDDGWITSPAVETAFRTVPRHLFVPAETPLEKAYDANQSVVTKKREDGTALSSVSAPWLQARMIDQAGIEPGMRVLEVGSGGFNAALLASIVGPDGAVASVDIDADVTARASAALEEAGYGDRVEVVTADAEHGLPKFAPYDAIVVTVGAWDLAASWLEQLTGAGRMAVPLLMNTFTRSLGLHRDGDHWVSTSAQLCGFVEMRGLGGHELRKAQLHDPNGGHVRLRFDQTAPDDLSVLEGVLERGPVQAWSGITIPEQVGFENLHLWLASFLPGFCRVDASKSVALPDEEANKNWFGFGGVLGDSFAVMELRKTGVPGAEFEFGVRAFGPHADAAAESLIAQITDWDTYGRDLPGDAFAYWPNGTEIPDLGSTIGRFRKTNGTATIAWPASK